MTDVLLYSGGLDSLMLRLRYPDAVRFHIDYGQEYSEAEMKAMQLQDRRLGGAAAVTVEWPLRAALPDGHVPHRNLALIVAAVAHTGADRVMLGGVRGETSLDKSRKFLRATGRALTRSEGRRVAVCAPLAARTKSQHLRGLVQARGANEAQSLLNTTTSCYEAEWDGAEVGCGRCLACFRKWVAVRNAGLYANFKTDPGQREMTPRDARYLLRAPLREWPGIVHNPLDARHALKLAR